MSSLSPQTHPSAFILAMAAAALGLVLAIPRLPGEMPWRIHALFILGFNVLSCVAALKRAAEEPEEGLGWRLLALGCAISMTGNLLWTFLPHGLLAGSFGRWILSACTPLGGLALGLGLLRWPWRTREGSGLAHMLGSAVFCLSILLLPWVQGLWTPYLEGQPLMRVLGVTMLSRLVLVGGIAGYLAAEDPRRLRGPLGWMTLYAGLVFIQMAFIARGPHRLDVITNSPWLGLTPLISAIFFMVPACRRPVEAPAGEGELPPLLPIFLLHLPFLASTGLLALQVMAGAGPKPWVMGVFLLLAAALVARQFMLQVQLEGSHRHLEARVRARTADLERMQDVALLNERLNAVVVLGAGLVHDLNKGLGSILNAAEVLRMELARRMKVSDFAVEAIIDAVERSANLSSRVMDFSKRLQEEGDVRDLRRELAALEGLLRLLVPGGVRLLLNPGQEPAPVRIHSEDLKQILVNLITNARDAMPGGGTIRVAVGKLEGTGETFLDVEDTGTGLEGGVRERMFDPFFTTKEPGKASGLGLSSVRILLDKAQGRVEVSSELGVGTRFRLLFPGTAHAA